MTLLLVALVTGLAFAHILERPAKTPGLYITLQKSLYVQWGPPQIGGWIEPAAIRSTLALAGIVRRRKRAFRLTGRRES